MTIYTATSGEKKDGNDIPDPEVVVGSILCDKKVKEPFLPSQSPALLTLTVPQRRRSNLTNLCVFLTALVVLATGVIGGIYLYKHLAHRTFQGWCGVRYYDNEYHGYDQHSQSQRLIRNFEEKIELDKEGGKYEKIEVPAFEECKRAAVLHDFDKNYTAIVDADNAHCFIMALNRTIVLPPKDLLDLFSKLTTGYYLPDARIVRQKYKVQLPTIESLAPFGYYIMRECRYYDTYRLVEDNQPHALTKRSADSYKNPDNEIHFGLGVANAKHLLLVVEIQKDPIMDQRI